MKWFGRIYSTLFFLLWAVIMIPSTLVLGVILIFLASVLPDSISGFLRGIPRFWGKLAVYSTFTRVVITGKENIRHEPGIFLSNHQSPFDIYTALGFYPEDFLFLSKKEIFKIPLIGTAMRKLGYISVDRGNISAAFRSLREIIRRLKDNNRVLIYPEGTRSENPDEMLPFKAGTLVAARQGPFPIFPVVLYGTAAVAPLKEAMTIKPGVIAIDILPPIPVDDPLHPAADSEITEGVRLEKIRERMVESYNRMKATYGR